MDHLISHVRGVAHPILVVIALHLLRLHLLCLLLLLLPLELGSYLQERPSVFDVEKVRKATLFACFSTNLSHALKMILAVADKLELLAIRSCALRHELALPGDTELEE